MTDVLALAPELSLAQLAPNLQNLVDSAKKIYQDKLQSLAKDYPAPAFICAAPGRVNLIGEHTDYTGGYVMPMAINRYTVAYASAKLVTGAASAPTSVHLNICSNHGKADAPVEERRLMHASTPPDASEPRSWVNYVSGTVMQYLADLPVEGYQLHLCIAYASDVPLGSGLSSSAALEVCTAVVMECALPPDLAYSSVPNAVRDVERALRCQKAENTWAYSPCGIMDQFVVSSAIADHFLLIDCRNLGRTQIPMKKDATQPVLLVTNSKVQHSIAEGSYGKRREECQAALEAMQKIPIANVSSLRDATVQDVETMREKTPDLEDAVYKRAKHVVGENARVLECQAALTAGDWDKVGQLMNASHASLKDDFEVSCPEIDFLVMVAQEHVGVYGSRITGGGFGGCTVTLVKKDCVGSLMEKLETEYKRVLSMDCDCFVETPSSGAQVLAIDTNLKEQ